MKRIDMYVKSYFKDYSDNSLGIIISIAGDLIKEFENSDRIISEIRRFKTLLSEQSGKEIPSKQADKKCIEDSWKSVKFLINKKISGDLSEESTHPELKIKRR